MKARVDSGELSRALAIVGKYTTRASSTINVTNSVLLETVEDGLVVRTTTYTTNAHVRVNAFDVEIGEAVVLANTLIPSVFDSGGFVILRTTPAYLKLEYEDTKITISRQSVSKKDFPLLPNPGIFSSEIDVNVLKVPAGSVVKEDVGHGAVTATIHITGKIDETIAVFGSDGVIGALSLMDGKLEEEHVAIDGATVLGMLSHVGDFCYLGLAENTVTLRSLDDIVGFSFSRSSVPATLLGMIGPMLEETNFNGDLVIGWDSLQILKDRLGIATRIDRSSEVLLSVGDALDVKIAGVGISMNFTVPIVSGNIEPSPFYCSSLKKCVDHIRQEEEIRISQIIHNERVSLMKIVAKDIHTCACTTGDRWKTT